LQETNAASNVEVREPTPMRSGPDEQTVDLKIPRHSLKVAGILVFVLIAGAVAFGTFNAGEQANRSINKLPVINNSLVEPQPMPNTAPHQRVEEHQNLKEVKNVGEPQSSNLSATTHKVVPVKTEEKHHTTVRREVRYKRRAERKSIPKSVVIKRVLNKLRRTF
jgi:hypothetical protein